MPAKTKEQCLYCKKMYLNRHVCKKKPNEEAQKKLEEKGKQLEKKAKLITKGGKSDLPEEGNPNYRVEVKLDGILSQNSIIIQRLEEQNERIDILIQHYKTKDITLDNMLIIVEKLLVKFDNIPSNSVPQLDEHTKIAQINKAMGDEEIDEQAAADAALYEDLQEQIEPDKPAPKELKFTPKFKSKKPKKKGFRMIPQKKAPKKEVGFTFPKKNFTTADKVIYNTKEDNSNGNGDKKKRLFASIKGETEKALLLDFGENDKEAWIPKSVIQSKYENVEGKNQNFIVQSWIIKKNNLEEYAMEE